MRSKAPERVIQTDWGKGVIETVYPVDIFILAGRPPGPAARHFGRFLREKINVIGVNTQTTKGQARMVFTAEIGSTAQLQKALARSPKWRACRKPARRGHDDAGLCM
jgi:GTP pyrophosphokinase